MRQPLLQIVFKHVFFLFMRLVEFYSFAHLFLLATVMHLQSLPRSVWFTVTLLLASIMTLAMINVTGQDAGMLKC